MAPRPLPPTAKPDPARHAPLNSHQRAERYTGVATPIEGVYDTSAAVTGARTERADPIDLPLADSIAALVLLHVPLYHDPGRHHQHHPAEYLAWLIEVIDEAERVLEPGGRLAIVAKPYESTRPHIDTPTQLLQPLASAGFTTPAVRTWLARPPGGSWQVLITAKNHGRRAGSRRQRRRNGLPYRQDRATDPDLTASEAWPIPATVPGNRVPQGALPARLVALLVSANSYIDDVIVTPLTGASTIVADIAADMHRRALCFEPDPAVLAQLTGRVSDSRDPA